MLEARPETRMRWESSCLMWVMVEGWVIVSLPSKGRRRSMRFRMPVRDPERRIAGLLWV